MNLNEDEIFEKYCKQCMHCSRKTLLSYDNEWTCIACGKNGIKRKIELIRFQGKKILFINRLKYAQHKIFCICRAVY